MALVLRTHLLKTVGKTIQPFDRSVPECGELCPHRARLLPQDVDERSDHLQVPGSLTHIEALRQLPAHHP